MSVKDKNKQSEMIEYMVKLCFLYNTTDFLTKIGFSDENAKAMVEAYKRCKNEEAK